MADLALVFLPGIMGSELTYQRDLIWPGRISEWFGPYKRMPQLTSTSASERNVIKKYTPFYSIYGSILNHLNNILPGRIYEFPYDWRRPNEESARKLAE